MPAPDSTMEEVRSSVLRYLRLYEEGQITLGDLKAELAAMHAPYEHASGAIEDAYLALLGVAAAGETDWLAFENAVTKFRRADAVWE